MNDFICLSCGHKWSQERANTCCVKCGHLYVKWVNYEQKVTKIKKEKYMNKNNLLAGMIVTLFSCGGIDSGETDLVKPEQKNDLTEQNDNSQFFWHGPEMYSESQDLELEEDSNEIAEGLGKLEQPIWLHNGMGTEIGNGMRCSRPYAGGECKIPDRKTFNIAVYSHTCTSNWQPVFEEAVAEANLITQQFGVHFRIGAEVGGGEVKFEVFCNDDSGGNPPGVTQIDTWFGYDCNHVGGPDYVCRYENGWIDINLSSIIDSLGSVYFSKTWAQQKRFVKNTILHELFHVWGLGHSVTGCGTLLMGSCANANDLSFWNVRKEPTATELKFLGCFWPGAATTPDPNWITCP